MRRDKAALFGILLITLTVVVAVFAPWLAPYDYQEQMFEGLSLRARRCRPARTSCSVPTLWAATC